MESLGIHKANELELIKVDHDKHVVGGARQGPIELWGGDKRLPRGNCRHSTIFVGLGERDITNRDAIAGPVRQPRDDDWRFRRGSMKAAFVNVNDDAKYSRAKARGCAIEAAARTCRDDGRALAALGIFMWALANGSDVVDAECVFLDAVLAAGGDWVAAKRTIVEIVALQSDLRLSCNDDLI